MIHLFVFVWILRSLLIDTTDWKKSDFKLTLIHVEFLFQAAEYAADTGGTGGKKHFEK